MPKAAIITLYLFYWIVPDRINLYKVFAIPDCFGSTNTKILTILDRIGSTDTNVLTIPDRIGSTNTKTFTIPASKWHQNEKKTPI